MVKKILAAVGALTVSSTLFAFNPPAGGQNFLRLTEPQLLSGAASTAGGGLFEVTPASVVVNPALTAFEQRIVLDVAGTVLYDTDDSDKSIGGAFQTGLLVPSRWGVGSVLMQGVWVPCHSMQLGNTINFNANFSKDVTDRLVVGMGAQFSFFYGYGTDWMGTVNMGALYNFGDLYFMKDLRFGAALMNIGKVFADTEVYGIKGGYAAEWPGLATPKTGVAATMLTLDNMVLGASFDLSFPEFQNFVIDTGAQMTFLNIFKVSMAWEYDAREFAEGWKNVTPSLGISCKFQFNSKDGSMMANKGWQQSEITVSSAYQQMYENIHAVSLGALLNLGLKDTQAPEIILWGEE